MFYTIKHNSQFNRRVELKFYEESFDILLYLGLTFYYNLSLERLYKNIYSQIKNNKK
jgi:hypothetical protein